MNFYVQLDDFNLTYFNSEEEAKEFAISELNNGNHHHVEYGVLNYFGWSNSCLVNLKEDPDEYFTTE